MASPPHPAPPRHTALARHHDRVEKVQAPALCMLEVEKTRQGARVGTDSGAFAVPKVIAVDAAAGRFVLERIHGITPLRRALALGDGERWCVSAGQALAAIHAGLALPASATKPWRPAGWEGELVPLHGDFSPTNVQLEQTRDRLWVLDWLGAPWLMPDATHGPPGIDIATFVLPLFWQRWRDPEPIADPEGRATAFLLAYQAASGRPLGPLLRTASGLMSARLAYLRPRSSVAALAARAPMQVRCWRLLRRLRRAA